MSKDLGVIEPHTLTGKWHWPFRQMEPGDFFKVKHSQRNAEDLRTMVSVRAAQLGKRFSFEKHDPISPTLMRVTCRDRNAAGKAALRDHLDWPGVVGLLQEQYGLDAQDVPWEMIERPMIVGRAARRDADHRWAVVAEFNGHRYVLELGAEELIADHLGDHQSFEDWKSAKLVAMMD